VPSAAADRRRLRALVRPDELERRPRVVVEAADEGRLDGVLDAVRVEVGAHLLEVLLALVAERLSDLRSVLQCRAHLLVLHVEDAEWARGTLLLRIVVENVLVRVEPRVQALDIRRAALAVADRVELELVARDAE